MKFKNYIRISRTNIARRKMSSFISIFFITLALTAVLLTTSLSYDLSNFMSKNFTNRVNYRSLQVFGDTENDMIDSVSKMPHVVAAVTQNCINFGGVCESFINPKTSRDGELVFFGGNQYTIPETIKGKGILGTSTNIGIIPINFYPDSNVGGVKKHLKKDYIDGATLIGKTLTIQYSSNHYSGFNKIDSTIKKLYSFKVVGVYDSNISLDDENVCYIPYGDVRTMSINSKGNVGDFTSPNVNNGDPIIAVVDNYKNVNSVISSLQVISLNPQKMSTLNGNIIELITIFGYALSFMILIVAFINVILSTISSVKERTREIGVLKAIGYKNKNVSFILMSEVLIKGIISYLLSVIISSGTIYIISLNLSKQSSYWSKLVAGINIYALLITAIIAIIIPVLGCLFGVRKAIKVSPSSAMKDL